MNGAAGDGWIDWEAGATGEVPVSRRYADPYYARAGGLAESIHVFLGGNRLAERWRARPERFTIAELGFGTGLNFLAAWRLWQASGCGGVLDYVAFEIAPMTRDAMARALSAFRELEVGMAALIAAWPPAGRVPLCLPGVRLTLIRGDARLCVPAWEGRANAWFLDGFAPARNPEMWEPALLSAVAGHTDPEGTFSTYSAAGHVRRALASAGFSVEKAPGFGAKREMARGRLDG